MTFSPRLDAPDPATCSPLQREIHHAIVSGPRGGVSGPLAVWLHRPELAALAQDLGRYCRHDTSFEPRLSELCILVTARIFGSEYKPVCRLRSSCRSVRRSTTSVVGDPASRIGVSPLPTSEAANAPIDVPPRTAAAIALSASVSPVAG